MTLAVDSIETGEGLGRWVRELLDEGAFQCDPMETQPRLF